LIEVKKVSYKGQVIRFSVFKDGSEAEIFFVG